MNGNIEKLCDALEEIHRSPFSNSGLAVNAKNALSAIRDELIDQREELDRIKAACVERGMVML